MNDDPQVDPQAVAKHLRSLVDDTAARLRTIDRARARLTTAPGAWSIQEVLGHLIDSAANNHQRFVRAQDGEPLVFPKYEQDHWVAVQAYNESPWHDLIELWRLYNHHLAQVMEQISDESLEVECRIGPSDPVTLGFLVEDYLVHLRHHVERIDTASAV